MAVIIEQFKRFYQVFDPKALHEIDAIYTDDVEFRDPIHQVNGRAQLRAYMEHMAGNLDSCRFFYLEEQISGNTAFVKWNMHFTHPKLAGGKELTVRGMSEVRFGDRIYYQEDFYDMGAMVYEHVPVFGRVVQWLRHRLAA